MRSVLIAAALLVGFGSALTTNQAHAFDHGSQCVECRNQEYGRPDLFYNFYVTPNCGGVGAQMYLAPVPVPARVGHTYYTYQPLMPHEMLYKHHRVYHRYYNEGRGLTRTSVRWW